MTDVAGILLCAGSSERAGFDKLLYKLPNGKTPMQMSLNALAAGGVDRLIIVCNQSKLGYAKSIASDSGLPFKLVSGGDTRQESVYNALVSQACEIALIHDAARCSASPELIKRLISSAYAQGSAVAAIPINDTIVRARIGKNDELDILKRNELLCVQTPQAFAYEPILRAYERAKQSGFIATDDSSVFAAAGYGVNYVMGESANYKLTTEHDIKKLERELAPFNNALSECKGYRTGIGEDTHVLAEGRPLILCGVRIPYERGLLGHSDADVMLHAVMDAILGAAGLADIGNQFPDTDMRYKGACSLDLLKSAVIMVKNEGFSICNVDMTLIAQAPKIAGYIAKMKATLSEALDISPECIGIKATTTEGMGPEGKGECMRANAIALLRQT